MRCVIIEDEFPAANRLQKMVKSLRPGADVLARLDSIRSAVQWFSEQPQPDLVFMDIQLADGLSFGIFEHVNVEAPVIFTTAYDAYALKAFKANSVDYLLKPIEDTELSRALDKFDRFYQQSTSPAISRDALSALIRSMSQPSFAQRFLIRAANGFAYVGVEDAAYFFSRDGMTYVQTIDNKRHHVEQTLEQLMDRLDPTTFFRINRKMIIAIRSIQKVNDYFNGRLKLVVHPTPEEETLVSRDRVRDFKTWLGG